MTRRALTVTMLIDHDPDVPKDEVLATIEDAVESTPLRMPGQSGDRDYARTRVLRITGRQA